MTTACRSILLFGAIVLCRRGTNACAGDGDAAVAPAMMQAMAKMDRDMAAAPMTGEAGHDFAAMMIPHHQGAIDMAKAYLAEAKDPALRRLAQEIIVTQAQEIAVMRRRLAA